VARRIPRDIVDAVREHTDMVQLVSRYVQLKRRGRNFVGLCPFHQEKSPSFNVVPEKRIYHCFGCQEGGDAFKFLMRIEGLSFVEAVKELAGPAGVTVPERELTDDERKALRRRATLYEVMQLSSDFYEKLLWASAEGEVGRRYLAERQITEETSRKAQLGWAPDAWSTLVDHMQSQGIPLERLEQAGLAKPGRQRHYDTFRNRLVFPIRDSRGRPIGMGGRLYDEGMSAEDKKRSPKYLNTPETSLYEKSKVLYGLYDASTAIRNQDRVMIVEGYFDVLALHQAGFKEAVATCGTALTAEHLKRLQPLSRNIVVMTDSDEAGSRAAERMLPMFLDAAVVPLRVELPGAKDPDEILRTAGREALAEAIDRARPLAEWVLDRRLKGASGVLGTQAILEELLPILTRLPERALRPLLPRLGPESAVLQRIHEARNAAPELRGAYKPPEVESPPANSWRPEKWVVHLFWLIIHRRDDVIDLVGRCSLEVLAEHPHTQPAVARLMSGEPVAAVTADEPDHMVEKTLNTVVAREELYTIEQSAGAVCDVLDRLTRDRRAGWMRAIRGEVERASREGDYERVQVGTRDILVATEMERAIRSHRQSGNFAECVDAIDASLRAVMVVKGDS
jgi:DNA primase